MSELFFSHNGVLKPQGEAKVSLFDINYAYGYGVYETLKLRHGVLHFPTQHCARLCHSAQVIGMDIPWNIETIHSWIKELIAVNKKEHANVKILCIGDSRNSKSNEREVNLYVLMLNPLFPPRVLYSRGAHVVTAHGERHFPTAKTLDMLLSAICYRRAQECSAYDTLLINNKQCVTEGTRTNLFVTDGEALFTPPSDQTLDGVTKRTVIECAREHGISVQEQSLLWHEFGKWKGVFLTSTSSKIVPVVSVEEMKFPIPHVIRSLIGYYNDYLSRYVSRVSP